MLPVPAQQNITKALDPIALLYDPTYLEQESNLMLDSLAKESSPLVEPTEPYGPTIERRPKTVSVDPDVSLTFAQLVTKYGCVSETHNVTTSDGYVLTMMRVNKTSTPGATPVFVQHGLFGDASAWIMNTDKSLAFVLANAGYDVWLGNNRGSQYSRVNNNINIDTQTQQWFDFSFYDLGKYDAPA